MKARSRFARLSAAAVAALLCAAASSNARNLTWDANGADDPRGADGGGSWDLTSANWVEGDLTTGINVAWTNTPVNAPPFDSAVFGNLTSAVVGGVSHTVQLAAPITVQDITLGTGADGGVYNISDENGGSLTLAGNVNKASPGGELQFFLWNGPINLTAGQHVFALRDTPGPVAELSINGIDQGLTGDGGITLDNGAHGYETWGTLAINSSNSYLGETHINNGRVVISVQDALGATSSGTTIGALGTLSIGGAGSTVLGGGMTISEPITISRTTYSGPEFDRYRAAVVSTNGTGSHTFNGAFVVNSNDARVQANTSTITIASNITAGPDVTAEAPAVLTVDGDFAGHVVLTGNNTGLAAGGVRLIGGVELDVASHENLGGTTAPITFAGSATLHPVGGFMTTFGDHPINNATFSGGVNVDENHAFTIDQPLGRALGDDTNRVGSIGKRGLGTLNLDSPINLRGGSTYWDAGVVNVNAAVELNSLHLRSPVVNINAGGSVTAFDNTSIFGESNRGTNGGPDKATVNINGGSFTQQATGDFFLSNDGSTETVGATEGTINLNSGTMVFNGLLHVARNVGAKGTINQSGGTFTLNRDGNFTLVLGSRNGEGTYNLSGGTMTSEGEFYVGQGGAGKGFFNMSGGTVNLDHWFVIGREGGQGTVDFSGGVFNKTRGGTHTEVDVSGGVGPSTMTVRNDAHYNAQAGDFRVGVGGGGNGTLLVRDDARITVAAGEFFIGQGTGTGVVTVQDNATITVNNWFAIGREGGNGTLNLNGGTVTKGGGSGSRLVIGAPVNRNDAVGTVNQAGGTLTNTVSETWINEAAASGTWNFSGGTANLADLHVGQAGGNTSTATLNLSGAAALNAKVVRLNVGGQIVSTINLDGGTLTAAQVVAGGGTGVKALNLNGGVLRAAASNATDWMTGAIAANVKAGGAKIDSNGFDVRVNTPLVHDAGLAGVDGGVTKSGAGSVTLAGANTYTGATTATAGTLAIANSLLTSSAVNAANDAVIELSAGGGSMRVIKTPTVTIASAAKVDLKDNKLITATPAGHAGAGGAYADGSIHRYVQTAYQESAWSGPGLTTTMPDAQSGLTTLAVLTGEQYGQPTFGGQSVTASDTIVMYTYGGDTNLDGKLDADDYGTIDFNVLLPGVVDQYYNGDFNYDGVVNADDYGVIDFNILAQNDPFPVNPAPGAGVAAAGLAGVTAVPEPASLSVIALAGASLLGRRRRRDAGRA